MERVDDSLEIGRRNLEHQAKWHAKKALEHQAREKKDVDKWDNPPGHDRVMKKLWEST